MSTLARVIDDGGGMSQQGLFFEILARDQQALGDFYEQVFGWSLQSGSSGFEYVTLTSAGAVRGGLGQAEPDTPGWQPGTYFYVMVDDRRAMDDTLMRVGDHGGKTVLPPTSVDGYTFAMFEDPEGNILGLVLPFPDRDDREA